MHGCTICCSICISQSVPCLTKTDDTNKMFFSKQVIWSPEHHFMGCYVQDLLTGTEVSGDLPVDGELIANYDDPREFP